MSKKMSTYLKEENLLTLLSQNNFIVPEIQREYVWGENEKVIIKFLNDLKSKIGICCKNCNLPSSENKINIGFLYSYKPDYVKIEHDRFLDENLIDGQQRFTTLFLLLFFCALKETKEDGKNRKDEFLTLIRFEEKLSMCFDFKVRDLTKRFMLELIEKIDSIEQLKNIDKQTWFLKDYQNDISIKSIQKALGFIQSIFYDNAKYYNHLINYVVFWHFKTEATSQGEELYITMNARGEELADNEVTKAALMIGDSAVYEWGKKWEEWQQFFWENRERRDINPSADKGLNGFLSCIAGLEYYLKDKEGIVVEKEVQKLLTLQKIEEYYYAFRLLTNKRKEFEANYEYSDWVQKCIDEIWSILNKNETDWFADYQDKNKSTERNRMVLMWSWLYYITNKDIDGQIEIIKLYRFLRFFYVRYKNNIRSVSTLKYLVEEFLKNGIWNSANNYIELADLFPEEQTDSQFRTTEEIIKYRFLQSKTGGDMYKVEQLIWQIEDHPLNIDGSDVGNINITHLTDLNDTIRVEELTLVRDVFLNLFPNITKSGSALLKTLLLHYGDFWKDNSYYHKRFDFSDWKRNIRKPEFKTLISELIGKTPETLLQELQAKFLSKNEEDIKKSEIALSEGYSLRQKLAFYSLLINPEDMWSEGEKVIIFKDVEISRLFKDENQIIYNSKGTVRNINDLWETAKQTNDNPLSGIKSQLLITRNSEE